METRASHLLIGAAVLLFTLLFLGLAVWLARVDFDRETRLYDIYFQGSVAGLGIGGEVRYRGIRIGTVTSIGIDPKDPSQVHVAVELDTATPIREGDTASLRLAGVTGVSYINIEGARAGSPLLTATPNAPRPVIPSTPSELERLFSSAPELVARATLVAERLAELLNEQNQQQIAGILSDMKAVSGALADQRQQIQNTLIALEQSANDVAGVTSDARQLMGKTNRMLDDASETMAVARGAIVGIDQTVGRDLGQLIAELRETNRQIGGAARTANEILQESREPLVSFSHDGLSEMQRFLAEARQLVATISRLTDRLESGGAPSLLGFEGDEVKPD